MIHLGPESHVMRLLATHRHISASDVALHLVSGPRISGRHRADSSSFCRVFPGGGALESGKHAFQTHGSPEDLCPDPLG